MSTCSFGYKRDCFSHVDNNLEPRMKIPTYLQALCILALTKGASAYFYVNDEDSDNESQETRSWWDWAVGNKVPAIPIAVPIDNKAINVVDAVLEDSQAVTKEDPMNVNPLRRKQMMNMAELHKDADNDEEKGVESDFELTNIYKDSHADRIQAWSAITANNAGNKSKKDFNSELMRRKNHITFRNNPLAGPYQQNNNRMRKQAELKKAAAKEMESEAQRVESSGE